MISCHELYAISSRLAQLTNIHDKPFGGLNVIFAGDFAQLPPISGWSLYSDTSDLKQKSIMSVRHQETYIGKLLWQQVTTVVILKQNMQQRCQSEDDAKLQTALENMRYGACTDADINFIRTRQANNGPTGPKLTDACFRNVSIITAWNIQKDKINEIGSARFAKDTGQVLSIFHSTDRLAGGDDNNNNNTNKHKCKNYKKKPILKLTTADKEALWNSDPSTSEHIAGQLSICVGFPIMI